VHRDTRSRAFEAKTACLHDVMEFVRKGALEASLPELCIGHSELLIEELFLNVCRYAYPDGAPGVVIVSYCVPATGVLTVEVADQGIEFNPLETAPVDVNADLEDRPVGGLGIHLLKTLASSLDYRREDGSNRLTFRISADS
jgi:anti-sigma regulatory factor (Ser/Thr protein kinase)